MSDQDAVAKLKKFLEESAGHPDHKRNYFGKKWDDPSIDPAIQQELKKLDEAHEPARKQAGDLPTNKPWKPSKQLCRELRDFIESYEREYGGPPNSPPYDQMYVFVRFAMPLVATAESEDGAAG